MLKSPHNDLPREPMPDLTAESVLARTTWRTSHETEGTFTHFSPLWGRDIEFHLLTKEEKKLTPRTVQAINEFMHLDATALNDVKSHIWEDAQLCFESIEYGGAEIPEGQPPAEANRAHFGVRTAEDAFKKSHLYYVLINEDDQKYTGNFAELHFDSSWASHKCVVIMRNGKIVGHGEDGVCLGDFDDA